MTSPIDGTYSVSASSVAGASLLVIVIHDGRVEGNDIVGVRYTGTVTDVGDGNVLLEFEMEMPPNTFAVWGTSPTETWMTRKQTATVPIASLLNGSPVRIEHLDMWAIFRRIPDDFAWQAGEDGYETYAEMFASLAAARRVRRSRPA